MIRKKKQQQARSILSFLRKDSSVKPSHEDFIEYLSFFDEYLWAGQKKMVDIAMKIFEGEEDTQWPVAVFSSGHATGKTWSLSRLAFFLALKYANGGGVEVVLLSPNKRITKTQMYRELKRCATRHDTYVDISITDEQITVGESSITPVAFSGRSGNSLQGYHGTDGTIFVIDEAAEFPKAVLQAAYSCASGHKGLIVMSGNPISMGKDADNALLYAMRVVPPQNVYNLSSGDHPNVQQRRTVIKGAVSWAYTANIVDEHSTLYATKDGECQHDGYSWDESMQGATITLGRRVGALTRLTFDTNKFKRGDIVLADEQACRRVFGLVVKEGAANSIISPFMFDRHDSEVENFYKAISRIRPKTACIGVDVARGGEDDGKIIVTITDANGDEYVGVTASLSKASTEVYCEEICKVVKFLNENGTKSISVAIDGTGGYGSGVVDTMKGIKSATYSVNSEEYPSLTWFSNNTDININIIDFLFSVGCKNSAYKKRYKNAVSLFAYKMKINTQVSTMYTFGFSEKDRGHCLNRKAYTVGTKYVLQPKKLHKKDYGSSPDSFDALLLTYVAKESINGLQSLYDSSEALERRARSMATVKKLKGVAASGFKGPTNNRSRSIPIKPKRVTR